MRPVDGLVAWANPWLPDWCWSFFKFGAKGGAGVVVTTGLLTVLVDVFGIPAEYAVFVAWALTLIPGYLVTDKVVFSAFRSPEDVTEHGQRGLLHYSVMWSGKAANYGIYYALLAVPGLWYQAAWVLGAVAVLPWTFGLNYWLWRKDVSGFREAWVRIRGRLTG